MEEIKVGEYVRTNEGYIAKMKHYGINKGINGKSCLFDNQIRDISVSVYDQDNFLFDDELDKYIVKHSPNIIDLIEEGDYVNGERVTEIKEWNSSKYGYFRYAVTCHYEIIRADEIKSIVTKEQFEEIEYKL